MRIAVEMERKRKGPFHDNRRNFVWCVEIEPRDTTIMLLPVKDVKVSEILSLYNYGDDIYIGMTNFLTTLFLSFSRQVSSEEVSQKMLCTNANMEIAAR